MPVLTLAEIRRGIELIPAGKRRARLERWLESELIESLGTNVPPMTKAIGDRWAVLSARVRRCKRQDPQPIGRRRRGSAVRKCFRAPQSLNQVKIFENSSDETVRSRGVKKVPPKAATSRRLPATSASGRVTVVPNLFAGDGRVHRFDAKDQSAFPRLLAEDFATSALICGDTETVLSQMPGGIFQTCVTSPPYWSLRDYSIPGQIGLEDSVFAYIDHLAKVFSQVRRVLKDDGTLWLNIGDSYTSGGRTWRAADKKNPVRAMNVRPPTPEGLKAKDLIGVPWLLAFALQKEGWYLRADIIWNKPNCQPESVKDRPTRSHEYIFLFSKSEHYRYEPAAVRGPNGRNVRTVWDIPTRPYPEAHFATFPPALVDPCIKLGSRPGELILDPFIGSGTTGLVALKLNRRFVGIELNPSYLQIAESRLNGDLIR